MRRKIVAGNWKMNRGSLAEAADLAESVCEAVGQRTDVDVVLCPPFTALAVVVEAVAGSHVKVGAQNLYPKANGAYTGEISPDFIKDVGCDYVIIGHSERRTYFKESNEFINEKVHIAHATGLIPILCVGETEGERDAGKTFDVVKDHVTGGTKGLSSDQMKATVIAYEPVWAIGTGKTAKAADAEEVHAFIRKTIKDLFNASVADAVRIQYGGSVKASNANELLNQPNIDGALVGGAALEVESFVGIIDYNKK